MACVGHCWRSRILEDISKIYIYIWVDQMMPILTPTIAARFGPPCRQKRLMSGKESSARKYAFGDRRMNTRRCSSIKFAKSAECSSHAGDR